MPKKWSFEGKKIRKKVNLKHEHLKRSYDSIKLLLRRLITEIIRTSYKFAKSKCKNTPFTITTQLKFVLRLLWPTFY
jgi:hypothetical protein